MRTLANALAAIIGTTLGLAIVVVLVAGGVGLAA